jgi:hypothetical protein
MQTNGGRLRWAAVLVLVLAPALCVPAGGAAAQDARGSGGPPAVGAQSGGSADRAPAVNRPSPGAQPRANQGARPSAAQQVPAAPQGAFDVVEWVVLVCDPNQSAANAERMFQSTMPEFAASRRPAAAADSARQPSPAGVIRILAGAGGAGASEGSKIDVLLQTSAGRFLGTWPKGKGRTDRQLWQAYELTAEPIAPKEVPPGHWFGALRDAPSLSLRRGRVAEKFLLYDVELNYGLPLRAAVGGDGDYRLSNNGAAALHDVTLFKPQDGKWRTGQLAVIPAAAGAAPATAPSSQPAAGLPELPPGLPPEVAARMIQRRVVAGGPGARPGPSAQSAPATGPSTRPSTGPSGGPASQPSPGASSASVAPDGPPADAAEALAPLGKRLESAGLLAGDVQQILRVLEKHALDKRRMTVVYRLDPAELDRLLPLEVTPAPRRTVRVGLVVARNIDPAVGDEIDQLVAQLASAEWEQREAASKQLADLGPAARPKLQAALQQKDIEVVWRAERLLQALETPPTPGARNGR